jgi:hypothetical protein
VPARSTLQTSITANVTTGHVADSVALNGFYNAGAGGALPFVASASTSSKLQKRADYVTTGTGDEVDLNAALAENAGGAVFAGLFNVSAPINILAAGQSLLGVGTGTSGVGGSGEPYGKGTCIKVASGFSGTAVIRAAYATGQAYSSFALAYPTIANLTIDGNSRTGTGIDGIHWRGFQGRIVGVIVDSCSGNGIQLNGYSGWATYDTKMSDLLVMRNGLAGVLFGADCADDHLMNSVIFDNFGSGIQMGSATTTTASHQITQVHLYANNEHGLHFRRGGDRTKVVNLKVEGNDKNGIFLDGTDSMPSGVQILGCNFGSNGNATHNTYSHIRLDSGISGGQTTTIVGNTFGNPYGFTNLCHSAIYVNGQPRYTLITGNNFGDGTPGSAGAATATVSMALNQGYTDIVSNFGVRDRRYDFLAPTAAAGANAGTSPPAPAVVGGSNDQRGELTLGPGTTPAAGAQVVVTFAQSIAAYGGNIPAVTLAARNSTTAALGLYISAVSATSFTVSTTSAPAASQANTVYRFSWIASA